MVEKFEIDSKVSKDDILKEFQAIDADTPGGDETSSMADRIALAKSRNRPPLAMVILGIMIGLVMLSIVFVLVKRYASDGVSATTSITVPTVTGLNAASAKAIIVDAGLRPIDSEVTSNNVPAGFIVGTTPAANTKVIEGSNVILQISKGKK